MALFKKKWPPEDIAGILGTHSAAYLSYANDPDVRRQAASGGSVTALLAYALQSKRVSGCLVMKRTVNNGKVRPRYVIARSVQELLESRGSTYISSDFVKDALPLIHAFRGKLACVLLPCDARALAGRMKRDIALARKIVLRVGLFCGHNSTAVLTDRVTSSLTEKAGAPLTAFSFRTGLWRGQMTAEFKNGARWVRPFSTFSLYQNLYFFCDRKCLFCRDHFCREADISLGDIWLSAMKRETVKHNSVLVRTVVGAEMVKQSVLEKQLTVRPVASVMVLDGQARTAPFHVRIESRAAAGKWLKINIPASGGRRVKWHEFVCAFLILLNWRISHHEKTAPFVFKIPRVLLHCYLILIKGLQSLS